MQRTLTSQQEEIFCSFTLRFVIFKNVKLLNLEIPESVMKVEILLLNSESQFNSRRKNEVTEKVTALKNTRLWWTC